MRAPGGSSKGGDIESQHHRAFLVDEISLSLPDRATHRRRRPASHTAFGVYDNVHSEHARAHPGRSGSYKGQRHVAETARRDDGDLA